MEADDHLNEVRVLRGDGRGGVTDILYCCLLRLQRDLFVMDASSSVPDARVLHVLCLSSCRKECKLGN